MSEYRIITLEEDEEGMDYIRTVDGDLNNASLILRVMQGHFVEWNKMAKVATDRQMWNKLVEASLDKKNKIAEILKDVNTEATGNDVIVIK